MSLGARYGSETVQISPKGSGFRHQNPTRRYFYQTLLQVEIHHNYYNSGKDLCPDFVCMPTEACQLLLNNLGMLFKPHKTGFSILYDVNRTGQLAAYLDSQSLSNNWAVLSFSCVATNAYFVNFSDINFRTNPAKRTFYLTNQQAHTIAGNGSEEPLVVLNTETYVTQPSQSFYKTVPIQFSVQFGLFDFIQLVNGAGRVIKSYRQCNTNGDEPAQYKIDCIASNTIVIDLACEPQGLYIIEWYRDEKLGLSQNLIYTDTLYPTLLFMDLLLLPPSLGAEGVYPITLRSAEDSPYVIDAVHYQVNFNRRSVHWCYWIVPNNRVAQLPLSDLSIQGMKTHTGSDEMLLFNGPHEGQLSDGRFAWYFISVEPLPLAQVPECRFTLMGKYAGGSSQNLVDPLPVASGNQLLSEFTHLDSELTQDRSQLKGKYAAIYVYL